MWRADVAVEYIVSHAKAQSIGRCAEFARRAVEAGGVTLIRTTHAKDYGISFVRAGFARLDDAMARYEAGDVVIMAGFKERPSGHMAMYTGTAWVSDFVQRSLYPGPAYRKAQPDYRVYRWVVIEGSADSAAL